MHFLCWEETILPQPGQRRTTERLTWQSGHSGVPGAYSPPQIMQRASASVPDFHSSVWRFVWFANFSLFRIRQTGLRLCMVHGKVAKPTPDGLKVVQHPTDIES